MGSTAERIQTTAIVIAYLASFVVVAAAPTAVAPTDSTPDTVPAQGHRPQNTEFDSGLHNSTGDPANNMDLVNGLQTDTPEVDAETHLIIENITDPANNVHEVRLFGPTDDPTVFNPPEHHQNTSTFRDNGTTKAEFPKVTFDAVGEWELRFYRAHGAGDSLRKDLRANVSHPDKMIKQSFNVSGVTDIDVEVTVDGNTRDSMRFPGDQGVNIAILATWQSNGSAVEGAVAEMRNPQGQNVVPNNKNVTDSDGEVTWSQNFWDQGGADKYWVEVCWFNNAQTGNDHATRNCKHSNENKTFVVEPAEVDIDDVEGLPVNHGFTQNVTYKASYPNNGTAIFSREQFAAFDKVNFTLKEPGNDGRLCGPTAAFGAFEHAEHPSDLWDNNFVNASGLSTADGGPRVGTPIDFSVTGITDASGNGDGSNADQVGLSKPGVTISGASDAEFTASVVGPGTAWFNHTTFDTVDDWTITTFNSSRDRPTSNQTLTVGTACQTSPGGGGQWFLDSRNISHLWNGDVIIEKRWNNTNTVFEANITTSGSLLKPEYILRHDFNPQAPEDVNLRITPDDGQVPHRDLGPFSAPDKGRPTGAETTGGGGSIQNTVNASWDGQFTLTVLGSSETEFPLVGDFDLTVTGPYLGTPDIVNNNGTKISNMADSRLIQDGIVNVRNITPARGDSEITFEVDWDGQGSEEISAEIGKGDILTTDTEDVTVGQETEVTLQLDDVNGNYLADGHLEMFWDKNGTQVNHGANDAKIRGDGTEGNGSQGEYTFTVDVNGAIGTISVNATDKSDRESWAQFEIVPAHDLDTALSPDEDLAGRDTEYTLNVTRNGEAFDDTGDDVNVYVLNEDEWDDFQENGTDALPSPGRTTETRDSEGNFTFNWRAAPGTYHVYVRTTTKLHDNDGQVPTIEVQPADISWDPETLVSKVDEDVRVDVHLHDPTVDDHDASEVNGTLFLRTGADMILSDGDHEANATFANNSAGSVTVATDTGGTRSVAGNATSIDITNGNGHIDNVTAERPGPVYAWFQDSESGAVFALTSEPLQVVAPNVDISPDLICVGVTTQVTATVTHPITGDAISGANFTLRQGGAKVANGTTNANGIARVTVFLTNSTQVNVDINGDRAATFSPKNCMSISFDKQTYTAGDTVEVTVSQRGNPDVQIQGATILLDGSSVGQTGSDGSMTFEAPAAGDHLVRAQRAGFADATADFTTESATEPSDFSVSGVSVEDADAYLVDNTYTVTGTVTNDGGEAGTVTVAFLVGGAQTDSTQLTLNPGGSQQVAFQWTPSSTGDVNLAISADGAQDSTTVTVEEEEPTVPGFEVVAVLAALGAAAVALRRRD